MHQLYCHILKHLQQDAKAEWVTIGPKKWNRISPSAAELTQLIVQHLCQLPHSLGLHLEIPPPLWGHVCSKENPTVIEHSDFRTPWLPVRGHLHHFIRFKLSDPNCVLVPPMPGYLMQ